MFFPEMDVIKHFLFLLLVFSLPGKAQQLPDSLELSLPDTTLSLESSLFLIEERTGMYFSYNPEILSGEHELSWKAGTYGLREIIDSLAGRQGLMYVCIGNQVVFHRKGQEPETVLQAIPEVPENKIRHISGRIFSSGDREALPYAAVWLPSTWEGTIANAEGYFILKIIPGPDADTIAISCMGYSTLQVPLAALSDSMNLFHLQASLIPIQEVVIRRHDPRYLLRQALNKIPDNHSRDPVIETAFYRETIRKNAQYVSVSEAVVDIYKPGLDAFSVEQVKVLRGRKNEDYREMDTLVVRLKGGLETSFLLDIVRNRPDFLQEDLFPRYNYRMSDIVVVEDRSAYAIDFSQKTGTPAPHYRGRIYLDLETLAFRGVEFELDAKTIASTSGSMVYRKPRKVKVRALSASYMVRYKSDGEYFYLSMIRAENIFRVRRRKKLFGNEFRTVSEMAVTGINKEKVSRFRLRETANPSDIFSKTLGGYDPAFWGPYNYIIPEESLEDALIRISNLLDREP
jgi:hypothetical protein